MCAVSRSFRGCVDSVDASASTSTTAPGEQCIIDDAPLGGTRRPN